MDESTSILTAECRFLQSKIHNNLGLLFTQWRN